MKPQLICPHCGNSNPHLLQENEECHASGSFIVKCIAPIKAENSIFAEFSVLKDEDAAKLVPCNMQWRLNGAQELPRAVARGQGPVRGRWSIFQSITAGLWAGGLVYMVLAHFASDAGVPLVPMVAAVLTSCFVFIKDPIDYPTRLP